jgi:Domain of unknown function (DUF929)
VTGNVLVSADRAKVDKVARRAKQRALQREQELARAHARKAARRNSMVLVGGGTLLAVLALSAAVYFALHSGAAASTSPAIADLGAQTSAIASPPANGFTRVGAPLYQNGKPELLFIGAQYCPHCAGQRWPVVKALSQFGTFSGLRSTSSSEAAIPTFDLTRATYASKYVSFDHKDVEDQNHSALQALDGTEQTMFNRYDSTGSIPLVLVGGYASVGDAYNLADIDGKSFGSVQHALQRNDGSPIVADINAEANALTAFLCHADGMKPGSVCGRASIRTIVRSLH